MPYRVRQWWQYKTQMEKILMVLLAITIFLIIVLASVMKHNVQRKPVETCSSLPCLMESVKIMRYTDQTADPCDDFYQFACGNFEAKSSDIDNLPFLLLQEQQLTNMCEEKIHADDHVIVVLMKRLFQTCVDITSPKARSGQTLKEALADAGGWPILEGEEWDEKRFDWKNASYKFRELGYIDELFVTVDVGYDPDNKTNFILEVLVPDAYDDRYGIVGIDKSEVVAEIASILGAPKTLEVPAELIEAHNLQQALVMSAYRKAESPHFKYTISDYQKLCDSINWLEFINNMLGPKVQVTGDQMALFPPPDVFKKVLDIAQTASKRAQANYVMWRVVENLLPYLSPELRFYNLGLQRRETRTSFCLNTIQAMGLLYPAQILSHRKYLPIERKQSVEVLLNDLKNELVQSLNRSVAVVFSTTTERDTALRVLASLRIETGPSDNYYNNFSLDQMKVEPIINPQNGNFLELYGQAARNIKTMDFRRLKDPKGFFPKTWLRQLPTYNSDENMIYAPNFVTHKIYFDEKRPSYINYAIIGTMLEHLLYKALEKAAGSHLNGTAIGKCLSENTSDTIQSTLLTDLAFGQRIAYAAYQNRVRRNGKELPLANIQNTPNQLFWITSASTFCKPDNFHSRYTNLLLYPKQYIYRTLRNSQRFTKDFNCPPGSNMNPAVRCNL